MIKKFNEVFEIHETDTIGTAIVKGYAKGYIQGIAISGITLGVLAIGNKMLSNRMESKEEEEIEEDDISVKA